MEEYATVLNFNSIKVQLELMKNLLVTSLWRNFNSIKVQLELYIVGNHFCSSFYFNSIKVQLEPASTCSQVSASADFNSIKVQLERSYLWLLPQSTIFQFHKGTIRTRTIKRKPSASAISIP